MDIGYRSVDTEPYADSFRGNLRFDARRSYERHCRENYSNTKLMPD